jgi:uncharacterized protein YceH (UPF0502 family)
LTPEELRVLGCLLEKQFLTPDVYPMTVNGILTACNQKTSREPVTDYDEVTVDAVLAMLQGRGLVARITGPDHRVPKSRELFSAKTNLRVPELAVLCVMMLRGPQTLNELQVRTNRIHNFADTDEVEQVVERLIHRTPQALVVQLPKLLGHKEQRYMHLLAGEVHVEQLQAAHAGASSVTAHGGTQRGDRVSRLETEIAALRQELGELRDQFAEFRKQFE